MRSAYDDDAPKYQPSYGGGAPSYGGGASYGGDASHGGCGNVDNFSKRISCQF